MRDLGKHNLLGVLVDAIDREAAVRRIIDAATTRKPFAVSALAVHGVMTGRDPAHRQRLNRFELLVPDGQPVRWGLNLLHRTRLRETVRGSDLTLQLVEAAADRGLPIFFYGSHVHVLDALVANLQRTYPQLQIAGMESSKFRSISFEEQQALAARIRDAGSRIVFVGLGCPRQETFVSRLRDELSLPLIAVGAAFDYLSGSLREPPRAVQRAGLEWLWRLMLEPRRLWRRYVLLNPIYLSLLTLQAAHVWTPQIRVGRVSASGDLEA